MGLRLLLILAGCVFIPAMAGMVAAFVLIRVLRNRKLAPRGWRDADPDEYRRPAPGSALPEQSPGSTDVKKPGEMKESGK